MPLPIRLLLFTFLPGYLLGLFLWKIIELPLLNPLEVTGPLVQENQSALSDLTRFLVLILLPAILLSLYFAFFNRGKSDSSEADQPFIDEVSLNKNKRHILPILFIISTFFISTNLPTVQSWGLLEHLHEGEALASAISYRHGERPYRDFYIMHGLYQEPLRVLFSFALFGEGIASLRSLESIHKIIVFTLLAMLLLQIKHKEVFWAISAFVIILLLAGMSDLSPGMTLLGRDIPTIIFVMSVLFTIRQIPKTNRHIKGLAILGTSAISTSAFFYSVDRGVYLTISSMFFNCLLFSRIRDRREIARLGCFSLLGLFIGSLPLLISIYPNYFNFYNFYFNDLPRYKTLIEGKGYDLFNPGLFSFALLHALVLWGTTYFVCYYNLIVKRSNSTDLNPDIIFISTLQFLSLISQLGVFTRADLHHIRYATLPLFLLTVIYLLWILQKVTGVGFRKIQHLFTSIYIVIVLFGVSRIVVVPVMEMNFPVGKPDETFLSKHDLELINYLENEIKQGESFYTFLPMPSLYYLLEQPVIGKFIVSWQSAPKKYQQELIQDLVKEDPSIVLIEGPRSDILTEMEMKDRLPLVYDYLSTQYKKCAEIVGYKACKR